MARPGWILPFVALLFVLGSCSGSRSASAPPPESAAPPPPPPAPSPPSPPDTARPGARGDGGGQKAKPPDIEVPQFPWPPPAASARETVPGDLLTAGRRLDRLGDVDS